MADNIELAKAYVTIVPSMQGAQQAISQELGAAAEPAGEEAGEAIGSSMLASLEDSLGNIGKTLTATVTAPIVAAAAASVAAFNSVDSALDDVAIRTGATGETLQEMQDIATDIATSMPVSWGDVGEAVGEINTRFGLTGEELDSLSRDFLQFSRINNQNVASSVDNVSRMIAGFGLEASDATSVLDMLNVVGQQTGMDVGQLSEALATNAGTFAAMGLSAEQAASFMSQASLAGLTTQQSMVGLRSAINYASTEGMDLADVFEMVSENADDTGLMMDIFGTRTGAAIGNAIANGTISLTDFESTLGDFSGSVSRTFDETLDPIDELTTTLNSLKELGYELVDAFGPVISQVADTVIPIIQQVTDAWKALEPETQQAIINIALIAAAIGPIILIASKFIGAFQTIGGALSSVGGHLANFGSSASSAASAATSAGGSFASMAGTALMLVALGAAIFLIAEGMSVMAQAAISLAEAGPAAIAVFFGMVGAATAMAVVILLVGSAATVGAVGLLALGAAVLMVSAGVSLIVLAMSTFVGQLPMIAQFAGPAEAGLARLNVQMLAALGASLAMTAGLLALSAAALVAFVPFVAAAASIALADVALAAMLVTSGLASAGMLLLSAALLGVTSQMEGIESSAANAADSLSEMVSSVSVVESGLRGLESIARSAVNSFVRAITGQQSSARSAGQTLGQSVVTGVDAGVRPLSNDMNREVRSALSNLSGMTGAFQSAGQQMGQAFVNPILQSIMQLQGAFSRTSFRFNTYIPLPHFSMSGSFDARSRRVPNVHVQWYKDAAEQGARFTTPQIIGVGDARQPEILLGEEKLKELAGGRPINITINAAQGQNVNELAEVVAYKLQRELNRNKAVFA
ncbi:MAG: phage tail tape measure protein [Oscillospiraceae bacterium]|nr:phage tail tape measure protein [Oscillospiraceae bacterium]